MNADLAREHDHFAVEVRATQLRDAELAQSCPYALATDFLVDCPTPSLVLTPGDLCRNYIKINNVICYTIITKTVIVKSSHTHRYGRKSRS